MVVVVEVKMSLVTRMNSIYKNVLEIRQRELVWTCLRGREDEVRKLLMLDKISWKEMYGRKGRGDGVGWCERRDMKQALGRLLNGK